jgi:hypothetical protein
MAGTMLRIGVAIAWTIGLSLCGIIYSEVFAANLFPLVDKSSQFAYPVVWLDNLVPLIIVILLLVVWAWTIAGAVENEKTRRRRRL